MDSGGVGRGLETFAICERMASHSGVNVSAQVNVIPLPAAAWMGFMLLGGTVVLGRVRKMLRRRGRILT